MENINRLCRFKNDSCNLSSCIDIQRLDCLGIGDFLAYGQFMSLRTDAVGLYSDSLLSQIVYACELDSELFSAYINERLEYYEKMHKA